MEKATFHINRVQRMSVNDLLRAMHNQMNCGNGLTEILLLRHKCFVSTFFRLSRTKTSTALKKFQEIIRQTKLDMLL